MPNAAHLFQALHLHCCGLGKLLACMFNTHLSSQRAILNYPCAELMSSLRTVVLYFNGNKCAPFVGVCILVGDIATREEADVFLW